MTKKFNRGFTLIELLVVIAIIGILSSVVLASLNTARNKGSDAAIKSQLAGLRAQAEIYYDNNSTYGANANCVITFAAPPTAGAGCTGLTTDTTFLNGLKGASTSSGANVLVNIQASPAQWAGQAALKGGGYWCVDSGGASKSEAAALGSLTQCA